MEYRKSRRDKGYETYIQTLLSMVEIEKMFIQHPELQSVWNWDPEYNKLSQEKRKIYHWCVLLLDIFEAVFIASPLNRGWMGQDEWDGWCRFISKFMESSEDFRFAWESNREIYSKIYRKYVDEIHQHCK